jgi:hypothetical protein
MNKIELQKAWWINRRPRSVKGPELERALGVVEQASDKERASALAALGPAIVKVSSHLDKLVYEALLKDLTELQDMAEAEAKKLRAAAKAKDAAKPEDRTKPPGGKNAAEDKLFDPGLHHTTLKRAMRQPLVFAFAVSSKAQSRALALSVRGNPKTMARLAKERSGGAKVSYGSARAAEHDPSTLVLTLEGPVVPGTERALRAYLKEHHLTTFKNVVLSEQEAGLQG